MLVAGCDVGHSPLVNQVGLHLAESGVIDNSESW